MYDLFILYKHIRYDVSVQEENVVLNDDDKSNINKKEYWGYFIRPMGCLFTMLKNKKYFKFEKCISEPIINTPQRFVSDPPYFV